MSSLPELAREKKRGQETAPAMSPRSGSPSRVQEDERGQLNNFLSGRRWTLKPTDERATLALMQQHGLPEVLAQLLVQRGIAPHEAERYLAPTLRDLLPDPFALKDMDKAVDRLVVAVQQKETIGIFGDYDVDGATSSALLIHYFTALGCPTALHIPDRRKEGYGPNIHGMQRLKDQGARLVVTVDTGTLAHAALQQTAEIGLEVIVADHHQGEPQLPPAVAVVNPNRFDESSEYGYLAAVGVTFLLLVGLQKRLREIGHSPLEGESNSPSAARENLVGGQSTNHKAQSTIPSTESVNASSAPPQGGSDYSLPNLLALLDLVALGTVCDVVPLVGLNRAFVSQGLKIMAQRRNVGLTALMDVAGLEEPPTPYHLGFILGPRINAGGRVGQSDLGTRLLTASHPETTQALAQQLDQFNKERKAIEAQVLEEALTQARTQQTALLVAQGENWHEGVIGIVAGRLKEEFNRPAAAISWNEDGIGKASARSVRGIDLGRIVIAARQQGLLEAGGGHTMAAGFTVTREKFAAFQAFVEAQLESDLAAYLRDHTHEIDAILPLAAATPELAAQLEQAGPFGSGNPTPCFLVRNVRAVSADIVGKKHLRCILTDADFAGSRNGARLKAMGFNLAETPLGQQLLNRPGQPVHIVGKLRREFWRGRESASLTIEDLALAE